MMEDDEYLNPLIREDECEIDHENEQEMIDSEE